ADQREPLLRIDDERGTGEEGLAGAGDRQVDEPDHRRRDLPGDDVEGDGASACNAFAVTATIRSSPWVTPIQAHSSPAKRRSKWRASCPISITSRPSGRRWAGAAARMRATRSMPSSPPASAASGSARNSAGSAAMESALTYGGLHRIR